MDSLVHRSHETTVRLVADPLYACEVSQTLKKARNPCVLAGVVDDRSTKWMGAVAGERSRGNAAFIGVRPNTG